MRQRVLCTVLAAWVLAATSAAGQGTRGWFDLTPDEQQRAWDNYQRYRQMPDRQRGRIEQRFQAYRALPPEERERLRKNYDNLKGLDENQRREFGENYRRWKSGE